MTKPSSLFESTLPAILLEDGDYLSLAEFERRYEAIPGLTKAELIEGVVRIPLRSGWTLYSRPQSGLSTWLGFYQAYTLGVEGGKNTSIRLDSHNEIQPDGMLIILPEHGGNVRVSEDDFIEGAPELVGEVCADNIRFDPHQRKRIYRRNQVLEYIVWRVVDQAIDWFALRNDDYVPLAPHPDGYLESEVFPGLRLDVAAMTRFDMATVLKVLQQGIESQAHAAFVAKLAVK